jgi:hypothetical protein
MFFLKGKRKFGERLPSGPQLLMCIRIACNLSDRAGSYHPVDDGGGPTMEGGVESTSAGD